MVIGCKLSKDDGPCLKNYTLYRSMIDSLLYVFASRLDIMQVVGMVARFQASTKDTYVKVVKRIFRYLKATLNFGLWYPKSEIFTLTS